jgi:hypothetical protein
MITGGAAGGAVPAQCAQELIKIGIVIEVDGQSTQLQGTQHSTGQHGRPQTAQQGVAQRAT